MMNENIFKGKWKEVKGEIQKAWGNLTGDELDKTKGDIKAISGLIQQKYGLAQESAREKLDKLVGRFNNPEMRPDKEDNSPLEKMKSGLKEDVRRHS